MSNNLLKGKRGIIFGALNDMSIAWKVAERAVEEGATITLSNTPVAVRMGQVSELSEKLHAEVIPADATSVEDLENVFKRSVEVLGGKIDFVLHSIGMSPNVRKKRPYDDLDYSLLDKTLDISAISFHKMLQVAKETRCHQRIRFGNRPVIRSRSTYPLRVQRHGRCQSPFGVDRPQFRIHLRSRKERAYQHHFAIAYHDDRRQRSQRHELSHGLCQPYVSAG